MNESWKQEMIQTTEPLQETLEEMVKVLETANQSLRARVVDQSYTFAYCGDNLEALKAASN